MNQSSSDATQKQILPYADVPIRIQRQGTARIEVDDAVLYPLGHPDGNLQNPPMQVRWRCQCDMLPDEMILIFGKPAHWTGALWPGQEKIPLLPGAFRAPFTLTMEATHVLSGAPELPQRWPATRLAWAYGVVLLRGSDRPVLAESLIHFHGLH